METNRALIDISPEHEQQIANCIASWIVALENGRLSAEDREYIGEKLPAYQAELVAIPKIRASLERHHHAA